MWLVCASDLGVNITYKLGFIIQKKRESLEDTKRELRENKEQSRTMYNKEDVGLFRKTLSDNVFFNFLF